ncbi:SDR family NAD(P)-dependent oxidoreductase [Lacticaseibacillus baoqingensis]|uniref:SDR family NAD(P)-dependent oxidoreductase n=1 Tax=Lacticaseibacillus baoqingensis TaxID=2486013 RepID=A0ABW4E2F4_9LACO|nr:SDR family NAD(P)-dependent oxidoreductase [Lacticaseibacillus baoqingensis]
MKQAIIITGANSGLGFETTKQIAERSTDYTLIMACRNMAKAKAARNEILKSAPDVEIICLEIDTSSLAKVRAFVDAFKQLNLSLYGLVCNAGIAGRSATKTADGFNNIFETNYLGHFLLTQLLLPLMSDDARIVTVSSERHDTPLKGVAWPGVKALAYPGQDAAVDQRSYPFSKLCMILFAYELDRHLTAAGKHIAVNTVNPGLMIETGLSKNKARFTPAVKAQFENIIGTAKGSGQMIVDLMLGPQFAKGPARYFDRSSAKPVMSSKLSYDKQAQDELWNFSMKTVGLTR